MLLQNALIPGRGGVSLEFDRPYETVKAYADDLIFRFGNKYLGDTCKRVGRDPERKLAPNDRLLGAIKICLHHGIDIAPIKKGVDAALDHLCD